MQTKIQNTLASIEAQHNVKILYACESGSRAWGFASTDSDYDVRFLYLRPSDWYLSVDLEQRRDVIELPLEVGADGELDVNGWDLRKSLQLFYKTNPPLLEWLGSPIVYRQDYPTAARLRSLMPTYYNPIACMYHYFKMADGNYRNYLQGEMVKIKKYFYVLRPVLAVKWLEAGYGVVPTEFDRLVARIVDSPMLLQAIEQLLVRKRQGDELDLEPRIPAISDFLDAELTRMRSASFEEMYRGYHPGSFDALNALFREMLKETWS
jgi:uncharacterized protein